ncbi:MAG: hypothetical protein HW421_667 [Ignavibacteria bacterium]|nr:hypothetical protein [Ignavibacteria bacterium]
MKLLVFCLIFISFSYISFCDVSGNVFLKNQTEHSGVKITFLPFSPTAVLDSTFSNTDGSYSIGLKGGIYKILYTKISYQEKYYNKKNTVVLSETEHLDDIVLEPNAGEYLKGTLSGTFTNETIYYVTDNISVPSSSTLIVQKGTVIKFMGKYKFTVNGYLIISGTKESPVLFTSNSDKPTPLDWDGFELSGTNALFENCIIEYCSNCIYSTNSNLIVLNCELRNFNSRGIISNKDIYTEIMYNNLHNFQNDDEGAGIWLDQNNNAQIECNSIYNGKGSGIYSSTRNDASGKINIINNLVYNIYGKYGGRGIDIYPGKPIIKNNVVFNCSRGISLFCTSYPEIINNTIFDCSIGVYQYINYLGNNLFSRCNYINNIIVNNNYGIYLTNDLYNTDTSTILNNLIWNNKSGNYFSVNKEGIGKIVTKNKNGDNIDSYFNLRQDPLFSAPPFLQKNSPCIGAGDERYSSNIGFDSTGICQLLFPVVNEVIEEIVEKNLNVYPNPASEFIEISVGSQQAASLHNIKIYNMLGECDYTNVTPTLSMLGEGTLMRVDVSGLPEGIYFVQSGSLFQKFVKVR